MRAHCWLLTLVLLTAGCGEDRGTSDMANPPPCPPLAGELHGAKCDPRVDTVCSCPAPCYMARCLCDGYWESDLVLRICDGGARD